MKRLFLLLVALAMVTCNDHVQGLQRGGAGGRGGGGGAFYAGGARPNFSPQANFSQQMARPPMSMPVPRAQVSTPQYNRPLDANLGNRMANFPSQSSPPIINKPSGGFNPGGVNRPNLPTTRPTLPSTGTTLPSTSLPGVGGIIRPGTGTGTLPNVDSVTRPGNVTGGIIRPGAGTGTTRPATGGGGDFLGMDKLARPSQPVAGLWRDPNRPIRPGGDNLPSTGGNVRPGGGDIRPGPITNRPVINNPINVGNQVNNVINRRPSWANINNVTINNINNHWNRAIVNRPAMNNWWGSHPGRYGYWNGWGNGIRYNWAYWNHSNWFTANWWMNRRFPICGWHYYRWFPYYPYSYWWQVPVWTNLLAWFNWNAATSVAWAQPMVYDYGPGGNVVYQNNGVYVGGEYVAPAADFAESAAALATVPPPATEEEVAQAQWMPLGTFALSTGEKDTQPSRILQLAVTKDGIIGGTMYNNQTDQTVAVQGRVDKDTQRVSFRLGDKENIVAETGMYNLTQNEAPLLVHFGKDKTEQYLLVRMESSENRETKGATPLPP